MPLQRWRHERGKIPWRGSKNYSSNVIFYLFVPFDGVKFSCECELWIVSFVKGEKIMSWINLWFMMKWKNGFYSSALKTKHAGRNLVGWACLIFIILIRKISTQMWRCLNKQISFQLPAFGVEKPQLFPTGTLSRDDSSHANKVHENCVSLNWQIVKNLFLL